MSEEKEHLNESPKDSPIAAQTEQASQNLFNDAIPSINPRSSSKPESSEAASRTTESGSETNKLFTESYSKGNDGQIKSGSRPISSALQDVKIDGAENKSGSRSPAASNESSFSQIGDLGSKLNSNSSSERIAQAISSGTDRKSTEYGAAANIDSMPSKISRLIDQEGSIKASKAESSYVDSEKALPYKKSGSDWDNASSRNTIETTSKVMDQSPVRVNSMDTYSSYSKAEIQKDIKVNEFNNQAFGDKFRQIDGGDVQKNVDKIYSTDWSRSEAKPAMVESLQKGGMSPDIYKTLERDNLPGKDLGGKIERASQEGNIEPSRPNTSVDKPTFGSASSENRGAEQPGKQQGESGPRGENNPQQGSERSNPSNQPGTQPADRNSPASGDLRPGQTAGTPQAEPRAGSAADQMRPNQTQGEQQRPSPAQEPRSNSPEPRQQAEQPRAQQPEQGRPGQAEQPKPAQSEPRPNQTEQPRNQTPIEPARNNPTQPEQSRANEIRAQQDQEKKEKDELARRDAIAHASAGANIVNRPAEQNNQQANMKAEASAAKELARTTTDQAGVISLKALAEASSAKTAAADQAKSSSTEAGRSAELNAKAVSDLSAKNAADSSKAATLDASKNAKVDATATGVQQNIAGKDILTGKVTASDTAAANAAAGKPTALNAADAAAVRAQLDGKNTGVNATGIRNDAINSAAAGKPGALNPAGIRGELPGTGPRTNAPGVIGAGGKFTEIAAGKIISGKALPGDANGGRRYLTGIEIGLLLAAAGVAKSRFDASRGTKDGAGLVLNSDGRMMSIRSGKDYIVGAFGEKGSQTLFALADGAKRFPSREITLSAVLAITGATKMRDIDAAAAGMRTAEQTIRIVRTVGKVPERKVEFEVPTIQGPQPETDGDEAEKDKDKDKDKLDSGLIGFLPAAPALFRAKKKDVSDDDDKKDVGEDADGEDQNNPIPIPRFRRIYKIDLDETLTGIAEQELGDINLAWLIADLNSSKITEYGVDGKRVVEIRKGQKLELPLPHEVVEFYKTCANIADPDNLVTIVVNTDVDRERLEETLNDVLGLRRKSP